MANFRRRRQGFTLVEGLVATVILVVAISAMFGSWSTCFKTSSKVAEVTAAAEICQANLETAKVFGAGNMPLGVYSTSTSTASWSGAYIPATGWTSGATAYYTYGGAQLASSTTAGVYFSATVTVTDSNVLLGSGTTYSISPTTIRAVVVSVTNVSTGNVDFTMATNLVGRWTVTRKGYTLVELLVSLIIGAVVMAVMLTTYIALWKDQNKAAGLTESQEGAKAIVWKMAESFRAASLCTSTDTGCDLNSGVESAGTSSVIINSRDSNGNLVKTTYAINNGNFQVTVGSGSPATYASGASMTLTYYTSATYNATALVPFTPTSSTDSTLIAVQIVGSVTQNGVTETYQTLVRLNNGP